MIVLIRSGTFVDDFVNLFGARTVPKCFRLDDIVMTEKSKIRNFRNRSHFSQNRQNLTRKIFKNPLHLSEIINTDNTRLPK